MTESAEQDSGRFVLELPLRVHSGQDKTLRTRFEAGRQIYNACLGECLRRLDLMRESKDYQHARAMPRGKDRTKAFRDLDKRFEFRKYDLFHWTTQFTQSWLNQHVDSQTTKRLMERAFNATREYMFGKRGRPRFRGRRGLNSLESTSNTNGIKWRDGTIKWIGLEIPAIVDPEDPVQMHGLSSEIKYCRIVKRDLNGKRRWFIQLVLVGEPLQRFELGKGDVGLDIGPSTIAAVGTDDALLVQFCAELSEDQRETRRLQRKIDRQRRANNPDCYDGRGRAIKGKHPHKRSLRMRETEAQLAEVKRKLAAYRKSLHGELAHRILEMGDSIKTEKLSYKALQRIWGKSVGTRAPGMFVDLLRRKAESAGGEFVEFSTYHTRLSQTCHQCGAIVKKSLSVRWHNCDCGITAQRDLYSAFLASCVIEGSLDADLARERWSSAGPLLQTAFKETQLASSGASVPASFGLGQSQSESSVKRGQHATKVADVVTAQGIESARAAERLQNARESLLSDL